MMVKHVVRFWNNMVTNIGKSLVNSLSRKVLSSYMEDRIEIILELPNNLCIIYVPSVTYIIQSYLLLVILEFSYRVSISKIDSLMSSALKH